MHLESQKGTWKEVKEGECRWGEGYISIRVNEECWIAMRLEIRCNRI